MAETNLAIGYGYGYDYGSSYGSGYGDGYGFGSGYGDGSGDGYGYNFGYGSGSGYGFGEFVLAESDGWEAYHYIRLSEHGFITRNGEAVRVGQHLHEDKIIMCSCGLHASLTPEEAVRHKLPGSVLTKVKVWGHIIYQKDKLVATDRQIIEVME